jgi:outer membrane receptor protein involved in Fe transport
MKLISAAPGGCAFRKLVFLAPPVLRFLFFISLAAGARGQTNVASASPSELKKLTLEELLNLEVTTVSKRPEKLTEAALAIQVITQEDIHRAGAASIPEALRLAPNLEVSQIDSRQWAISARGFDNAVANKLLVLIDGRAVYTPLFAGVFWDAELPGNLGLDVGVRYVSSLPAPSVPGYIGLDVRLQWRPIKNVELAVVGQNLVDRRHPEFGAPATRQEIERSV